MKKLVLGIVLAAAAAASADMKVGTVDMMALVKNHRNYETNRNILQSTEKDYQGLSLIHI